MLDGTKYEYFFNVCEKLSSKDRADPCRQTNRRADITNVIITFPNFFQTCLETENSAYN